MNPCHFWDWLFPSRLKLLLEIREGVNKLMSAISDYAARENERWGRVETGIDGLVGDVAEMKRLIAELQNSAGQISAEDQATLDALDARAETATTRVTALDAETPPASPPA